MSLEVRQIMAAKWIAVRGFDSTGTKFGVVGRWVHQKAYRQNVVPEKNFFKQSSDTVKWRMMAAVQL